MTIFEIWCTHVTRWPLLPSSEQIPIQQAHYACADFWKMVTEKDHYFLSLGKGRQAKAWDVWFWMIRLEMRRDSGRKEPHNERHGAFYEMRFLQKTSDQQLKKKKDACLATFYKILSLKTKMWVWRACHGDCSYRHGQKLAIGEVCWDMVWFGPEGLPVPVLSIS